MCFIQEFPCAAPVNHYIYQFSGHSYTFYLTNIIEVSKPTIHRILLMQITHYLFRLVVQLSLLPNLDQNDPVQVPQGLYFSKGQYVYKTFNHTIYY